MVNAGGWGVYRVAYDDLGMVERLAGRLGDLEPLERFNLFADTWALVLAGRVELSTFVTLAGDLAHEDEPGIFLVSAALGPSVTAPPPTTNARRRPPPVLLLGPRASALGWNRRTATASGTPPCGPLLLLSLGYGRR